MRAAFLIQERLMNLGQLIQIFEIDEYAWVLFEQQTVETRSHKSDDGLGTILISTLSDEKCLPPDLGRFDNLQ